MSEKVSILDVNRQKGFYVSAAYKSEFAQLLGSLSPSRMWRKLVHNSDKGKRTIVLDVITQNFNLPSLQGGRIGLRTTKNSLLTDEKNEKAGIRELLMSAMAFPRRTLWASLPGHRNRIDIISYIFILPIINRFFIYFSTFLEVGLKFLAAVCTQPVRWFMRWFHLRETPYTKEDNDFVKFVKVATLVLFPIPIALWCIAQVLYYSSNVLCYTRHLLDAVSNLITTTIAKFASWVTGDKSYEDHCADYSFCAKSILKNTLLLIPTIIALVLAVKVPVVGQFFVQLFTSTTIIAAGFIAGAFQALTGIVHYFIDKALKPKPVETVKPESTTSIKCNVHIPTDHRPTPKIGNWVGAEHTITIHHRDKTEEVLVVSPKALHELSHPSHHTTLFSDSVDTQKAHRSSTCAAEVSQEPADRDGDGESVLVY